MRKKPVIIPEFKDNFFMAKNSSDSSATKELQKLQQQYIEEVLSFPAWVARDHADHLIEIDNSGEQPKLIWIEQIVKALPFDSLFEYKRFFEKRFESAARQY